MWTFEADPRPHNPEDKELRLATVLGIPQHVPVGLFLIVRRKVIQKSAQYSADHPLHNPVDKESRPVPVPRLRTVHSVPVLRLMHSCRDCLEIQQTAPPHCTDSAGLSLIHI